MVYANQGLVGCVRASPSHNLAWLVLYVQHFVRELLKLHIMQ